MVAIPNLVRLRLYLALSSVATPSERNTQSFLYALVKFLEK
jgi:hypothetical protein